MMPVSQGNHNGRIIFLAGMSASLLGGIAIFGWIFGFPLLTRIRPDWSPMVPETALCFLLGGLSLMNSGKYSALLIGTMLLLSGARLVGLAAGIDLEFMGLLASIPAQHRMTGHMSPETALGFLAFGIGTLAWRRGKGRKAAIVAWTMAAFLLLMGSAVSLGYFLRFQDLFEKIYVQTGLIWMSLTTAIGMALLGIGLIFLLLSSGRRPAEVPPELRIYRITAFVVAFTSLATVLVGMKFLEEAIFRQSVSDMMQTLDSRRSYIDTAIDYEMQQIMVASDNARLRSAEASWFEHPDAPLKGVDNLIASRFSGIAIEQSGKTRVIAGSLVPASVPGIRLMRKVDATLLWEKGYFLRVRLPGAVRGGFIVFELPLPRLDRMFAESMHWGETGTMPMCGRLDGKRLLCYPQREQAGMYVVPDAVDGVPLPMAHALAGSNGIAAMNDYRGRKVLSAYGPIGRTGLGLVLRMDINEVYAPVRRELFFIFPLVATLIAAGLWLVRTRVKPLAAALASAHAAERNTRARFEAATESSPDAFVILESARNSKGEIVDFRHVYANSHAARMMAMSVDEMLGRSFLESFPEQMEAFAQFRNVVLSGKPFVSEFSRMGENGEVLWFQRQVVAMPEGVAVTSRNITQEKRLLRELESSNRLRTAILESAAYSIISTDVEGRVITFNKAAERMLWYRADEVVGKTTLLKFHDMDEIRERAEALSQELHQKVAPDFEVFAAKAKRYVHEEHEWTYIRKDGSRFPVRLSMTPLQDEGGVVQGFLGIAYDIAEEKRMREYIRHIALHDVLTGLPNRALLEDRVNMAIELQQRKNVSFALGMMDIDRFKNINDSMGHHIGDRLLREFVERVKSGMRPSDTLARMGGDEFVLLLAETDEAGVAIVAERILKALMVPVNTGTQELHITSSIGFSICPRDGKDLNELLRCADVAMYWVKEHGRNGYRIYSREMDVGAAERMDIERSLRSAIENEGFSMFYQPKVDLKSGIIVGVEALLRLRKRDGQYVSPEEFIPLAEETGLIVPIGKWVLETACRDAKRMESVAALEIAVNISARQFMSGDFVGLIRDALSSHGIEAGRLELEITESLLMDERSGVAAALSELDALGVTISIDDFGTGYSSLGYLKRYPVRQLKIDRSFVRDMTTDKEDAALIAAIIAMGHSLGMPVIAEGIEAEEQIAFLLDHHCDQGQGFHIGVPMPFDALLKWISENGRWVPGEDPLPK